MELILDVKIRKIEYPEKQKTLIERYGSKSIRLDVYVADEAGTVYDVEIQTTEIRYLPKRTRYYQSVIDLNILEKGEEYIKLRPAYVIFICTYDPFGQGRYVYTFENLCREDPRLALGDGATKIILNTKGSVGQISDDLKTLLRYMDGFAPGDDYTRELDRAVKDVRANEKWRREFMVLIERDRANQRLGERRVRVAQVRKFRNRYQPKELAEIYFIHSEEVRGILDALDAHPDWDDEQVAESIDFD